MLRGSIISRLHLPKVLNHCRDGSSTVNRHIQKPICLHNKRRLLRLVYWHFFRVHQHYMSLIFCFRFRVNQCLLHDQRKNICWARPLETFIVTMICIFCFQNQTYFFRMPKSPELDLPKRHRSTYSNHIRLNSFCRLIGYLRLTNSGFLCKIE